LNRVQLEGILKAKSTLRFTPAGLPALEAVLSVTETGRPDFDVGLASFGEVAETLQKLALGSSILVTGRLQKAQKSLTRLNILVEILN
jgi:primosomal replication protein N